LLRKCFNKDFSQKEIFVNTYLKNCNSILNLRNLVQAKSDTIHIPIRYLYFATFSDISLKHKIFVHGRISVLQIAQLRIILLSAYPDD
jgi:hypothetical protein